MKLQLPDLSLASDFPRRIVCLSDETTETLYLLGAQDRIAGVSGFTVRPPAARRKPRVSAFNSADIEKIIGLSPDLVLTFCDVQAEITKELVLRGVTVFNFNQRTVSEIFQMILTLARLVGKYKQGMVLVEQLHANLREISKSAEMFGTRRPRVFFEEWNDPIISGIGWVEELIEIAGGEPIFPELRNCGKSRDRVVDPAAVVERNPDVILASWCGMKVDPRKMVARPDWSGINAVRNGQVYEIKSSHILQPGPAALTEGVQKIHAILSAYAGINLP